MGKKVGVGVGIVVRVGICIEICVSVGTGIGVVSAQAFACLHCICHGSHVREKLKAWES